MTELQRVMERIMREAHDLYPATSPNFNSKLAMFSRQAEFVIRELRYEIVKQPSLMETIGFRAEQIPAE